MSQSASEHREQSPAAIGCAVITVSDTRTLETDTGGALLIELLESAGHQLVDRQIIPDEPTAMRELLVTYTDDNRVRCVLMTGGTGISARDQTFETVSALLTKPLPGYGELFRLVSYEEIGSAAMLSRAVGGLMNRTVVLTMPGSRNAVRTAMQKLILPELGHLVHEATK